MLRRRSAPIAILWLAALVATVVFSAPFAAAQQPGWALPDDTFGNRLWRDYFVAETERLRERTKAMRTTREAWEASHAERRRQLQDMLGLYPWPDRTDLKPEVTGTLEGDGFVVERLEFQSLPGLYVTGNLYLPKEIDGPLPTVLYVCGHARAAEGDESYGNKTAYQHHGAWFARNGYACLTIDTVQLGEIEGKHHGTYRYGMWWWNARGYTSAGVEAWNCIRALDYLQSRPEVDGDRLGVTGRSGGGAYSWWTAALDDRIKAAAPVAGVADLENHVVDGCVEGHCDCMFFVNTYRWDYPMLAALVAPRPLLIVNTDNDNIFPLDGVMRVHSFTRDVYRLLGAEGNLGLQISEGPHEDSQNLQVPVGHWFNRFLRDSGVEAGGQPDPVRDVGVKYFEPKDLRVFGELPEDEINTRIEETFVAKSGERATPASEEELSARADEAREWLRDYAFNGWPEERAPLNATQVFTGERDGVRISVYEYTSQEPFRLRMFMLQPTELTEDQNTAPEIEVKFRNDSSAAFGEMLAAAFPDLVQRRSVKSTPAGEEAWDALAQEICSDGRRGAFLAPRGVDDTEFTVAERRAQHFRRRLNLLGQTLDGMQLYDLLRGLEAVKAAAGEKGVEAQLTLAAEGTAATAAMYAALFASEDLGLTSLKLREPTATHRNGPIYLNVLRQYDAPDILSLTLPGLEHVELSTDDAQAWGAASRADKVTGGKRLEIVE